MKTIFCFSTAVMVLWGASLAAQVSFVIFDEQGVDDNTVTITAERAKYQTNENRSVFTGNVVVVMDDIRFRSESAIIQFLGDSDAIDTLTLVDNVYVEQNGSRTYSDRGIYNHTDGVVRLVGHVRYAVGRMEASGDVFTYDINTGEGVLESVTRSFDSN